MLKLVVGCGYLGLRVARAWRAAGHDVAAVTRSERRAEEFAATGLQPIIRDMTDPDVGTLWPAAECVLFALGYDRNSGHAIEHVYQESLANLIRELPTARRVIYISSTGVYGQNDGSWVDEDSPCIPARPGGRACLSAERLLRSSDLGPLSTILRLAGIYGPSRIPRRREIEAGLPIPVADGYLNLIHVEDAARAVLAVEDHPEPASVYTLSDGHPVTRKDYLREMARLLRVDAPRFTTPETGSASALRALAHKRVLNDQFVRDCSFDFHYPSYREGLASIIADEK